MRTLPITCLAVTLVTSELTAQNGPNYDDRPKITVTGESVVNVAPDRIVINFGIETLDVEIEVSKRKNNEILAASSKALAELGIPARDLQTDHLSIHPEWTGATRRSEFLGYFTRNRLVLTLSDATKVEAAVTKALEAGVNYIHGVDFQTSELRKYRDQARETALRAAREKAEKMAGALGRTIGAPLHITENNWGNHWGYYSSWWGWDWGGRGRGMSQANVQIDPANAGAVGESIALGKLAISANVSVVFELK